MKLGIYVVEESTTDIHSIVQMRFSSEFPFFNDTYISKPEFNYSSDTKFPVFQKRVFFMNKY